MSFHQFPDVSDKPDLGTARVFVGDGSPRLKVPGILEVSQVRVGEVEIPLSEKRKYPTDSTGVNFEERDEPMIDLQTDPADGSPTLLRSTLSNDGLWQAGVNVYVSGKWEPAKGAKAKPTPEVVP